MHLLPQAGDKSLTCRSCPGRETELGALSANAVISSLTCPCARGMRWISSALSAPLWWKTP